MAFQWDRLTFCSDLSLYLGWLFIQGEGDTYTIIVKFLFSYNQHQQLYRVSHFNPAGIAIIAFNIIL